MVADDETVQRARARLGSVLKGKYRLDAILGIGGMATVYRATHRNRARFAVKMLHPDVSMRAEVRTRFLREGYAANSVEHPGVVRVVDDDVEDGSAFLVMDLLEGLDAEKLAEHYEKRISPEAAACIVHELLDVLESAHRAGIVHRDIKPANVFLCADGSLKVLDFGIARVLDATAAGPLATATAGPMGTPAFMAPEQALSRSDEIGSWTDVWAAGATLFTLASGRTVHEARTTAEMLVLAATQPAEPLERVAPGVPSGLAAVVDRALRFDRGERWASAAEMHAALGAVMREQGWGPPARVLSALVREAHKDDGSLPTAPTVASHELPTARSSMKRPAAPRRRRFASYALAAIAVAGVGTGAFVWRKKARSHPVVAPSASVLEMPHLAGPPFVLILGFDNKTLDPMFDGGTIDVIVESALTRSTMLYPLAGSTARDFVADYEPRASTVDQATLKRVAVRAKRPIYALRGKVVGEGHGYGISARVVDVTTGAELATASVTAKLLDDVVPAVARMTLKLRAQLHDTIDAGDTSGIVGASQSLDADHEYAAARGGWFAGRTMPIIIYGERAVEADPSFALGHATLARQLYNEGREGDALKHLRLALAHTERLSDREKSGLVFLNHLLAGDGDEAARDCEAAIRRWPADPRTATIRLPVAYMVAENVSRALESARSAAGDYPRSAVARSNFIQTEVWAGELDRAAADGKRFALDFSYPVIGSVVALALTGRGEDARAACREVATTSPARGDSACADLAIFRGRFDDAAAIIRAMIARESAAHSAEDTSAAWALLAELELVRGNAAKARAAAKRAATSDVTVTRFRAARVLVRAGAARDADELLRRMSQRSGKRVRLYLALLRAEVALAHGDGARALTTLREPGLLDSWLVGADRARAYAAAGDAASAKRELDACYRRRGQGAMVFPENDSTTLRYLREVSSARK
jgi:serine/threonine protein kinase/tetratricopeptide (TPR) repeat protein